MKEWISFGFWILVSTSLSSQVWSKSMAILDNYIEQVRKEWKVPRLAVSVVKDGKLLLMRGYGQQHIARADSVDTQTLYAICSTTKAMTAADMSMLVDEGKINWDDPVVDHLAFFQLKDPYATRTIRIRDLFTHNSGLGNGNLLWYMWKHKTSEIIDRRRMMDLSYSIRGGYTYQNLMYPVAGKIIGQVSGLSWGSFLTKRIFNPLGMVNTYPTQKESLEYANPSTPHYLIEGKVVPIEDGNADQSQYGK